MSAEENIFNNILTKLGEKGCAVIKNIWNVRYLTGFTGTSGFVFVCSEGSYFFTDFRYEERAEKEVKNCKVKVVMEPVKEIINTIREKKLKVIGVEYNSFTLEDKSLFQKSLRGIRFKDIGSELMKIRSVKRKYEVEMIRRASRINKKIFYKIIEEITPGITERNVAWRIESLMREYGCDAPYFSPIVAVDPQSAVPHALSGKRKLKAGRGVLLDFGSVWKGYSTDETLTVYFGKPNEEYKRVWLAVRDAKNYAISAIKPGVSLAEPERKAREYLEKKGLDRFFTHSLGHGVGLEVHEYPHLSLKSRGRIEEGMVFTVEPGVYIKGKFGVRLEDVVYVSRCGVDIITQIDKEEVVCV